MDNRWQCTVIKSVTDAIANLRQGDYLFLDIDDTLVVTGLIKYQGTVSLIEKSVVQQIKVLRESGIHVIGLTARKLRFKQLTHSQLQSVDIQLDDIIHAPSDHSRDESTTKGVFLKQYIEQLSSSSMKPKRIIVIDDNIKQLNSIAVAMSQEMMPCVLYHYDRPLHYPVNVHQKKVDFPDRLDNFTQITSLGGGTRSTFLIKNPTTQQQFVVKAGINNEAVALEMLCNAIYHVLSVPVPSMHVYHQVSKKIAKKLGRASCHGVFQLSDFIVFSEAGRQNVTIESARKHFMVHALLGNIDVAKEENFIGPTLIDSSANFLRRARGKDRKEDPSWLTEISSLRNANINPTAHAWFSTLTDNDLQVQARAIIDKSSAIEQVILSLSDKLHLSNQLRDHFLKCIAERMDVLIARYAIANKPIARIDKKPHPNRTAAGVLTYRMINRIPYLLLAKRAKHEWWDNFGGKSDTADLSLAETASREVAEESSHQLCYDPIWLDKNSSHDIVTYNNNGDPFTYRMYIMPDQDVDLDTLTDHEHTSYRFVPLSNVLEAINNNSEICEGQKTVRVSFINQTQHWEKESILLYPPLYDMLQQSPVYDNLNRLLLNKKLKSHHTQGSVKQTAIGKLAFSGYTFETTEMKKNYQIHALLNHVGLLQELKRKNSFVPISIEETTISQSELYLKMLLREHFNQEDLKANLIYFFDNMFAVEPVMTQDEKNRLITACMRLIETERKTGNQYVYFYHACNDVIAFVYSVYSLFYENLNISNHWPVFRERSDTTGAALYSNVFLFGNHDRQSSCSLYYFMKNITHDFFDRSNSPDMFKLLATFINYLHMPTSFVNRLIAYFTFHQKKLGGALYQIRLPVERISKQVSIIDYRSRQKYLDGDKNIANVLAKLKQPSSNLAESNVVEYMRHLQASIVLTPADHLSVQPIYWNMSSCQEAEISEYQSGLRSIIHDMTYYVLSNANSQFNTAHSAASLSRLLLLQYQSLGFGVDEDSIVSQLNDAISNKKSDVIVRLLTSFPHFKYRILMTQEIKGEAVSLTTIEMIVLGYEGLGIDWMISLYGPSWWLDYPVKSIDDLRFLIVGIFPDYDAMVELLLKFKNIIQRAPIDDLWYLASSFCKQGMNSRAILFSNVFTSDNCILLALYLAKREEFELVNELLPYINDKDLNRVDHDGRTLLYLACIRESSFIARVYNDKIQSQAIVQALKEIFSKLSDLVDPNIPCAAHDNDTPLHAAIAFSNKEAIKSLLAMPTINVHIKNDAGKTPLLMACDTEMLKLLFEYGGKLFSVDDLHEALLMFVSKNHYKNASNQMLIDVYHYTIPENQYLDPFDFELFDACQLISTSDNVRLLLSYLKQDILSEPGKLIDCMKVVHLVDILAILSDDECLKIAKWDNIFTQESDLSLILTRLNDYPSVCEELSCRYPVKKLWLHV